MELKLHFTEEEIFDILYKLGYTITTMVCYIATPVYHNDVEYTDVNIWIAYKDTMPIIENRRISDVEPIYGINTVFTNELKNKILNLF